MRSFLVGSDTVYFGFGWRTEGLALGLEVGGGLEGTLAGLDPPPSKDLGDGGGVETLGAGAGRSTGAGRSARGVSIGLGFDLGSGR